VCEAAARPQRGRMPGVRSSPAPCSRPPGSSLPPDALGPVSPYRSAGRRTVGRQHLPASATLCGDEIGSSPFAVAGWADGEDAVGPLGEVPV